MTVNNELKDFIAQDLGRVLMAFIWDKMQEDEPELAASITSEVHASPEWNGEFHGMCIKLLDERNPAVLAKLKEEASKAFIAWLA